MQTSPQSSFDSPNHQPAQSVSHLTLALPLSQSVGGALHAMPGGITHPTQAGIPHTMPGGVRPPGMTMRPPGGISHALPLASCASPNFPLTSIPLDSGYCLPKIKLVDILPEDGPPSVVYRRAVEELSCCLSRHGAAILELSAEDAALVRCALESATLYFRTRAQTSGSVPWSGARWSKTAGYVASATKDMYYYKAGRNARGEEVELPPPCMSDVFRCLGKASRIALGALSRYLRLRSDAFFSLLDDCPLPDDCASSSVLVATHFHDSGSNLRGSNGTEACVEEFEKGLLTLIASDSPGLQVCDINGHWYLADIALRAGDLLLITGRSLQHVTAGIRRASAYRVAPLSSSGGPSSVGRTSLTFRLMPRGNEILDGSTMADAGHVVSEGFTPVLASKFLEGLNGADAMGGNKRGSPLLQESISHCKPESTSLRSLLSDPLTGTMLDDAYTALSCGHSFGGGTLKRVTEMQKCSTCGAAVNFERMIPNHALRAAAAAFKREESRRQLHSVSRKRRKELVGEHEEKLKRLKELQSSPTTFDGIHHIKGVQYPFDVNEKVLIKGNKRTPEKFVGREAIVTSKCLNGWYLLRTLDNGESVRLQYRSLQACTPDLKGANEEPPVQQQSSVIQEESSGAVNNA